MPPKPIRYVEIPLFSGNNWQSELVSTVYCSKCRMSDRPGIWVSHEWYDEGADDSDCDDMAICIGCLTEAINELVPQIGA